MPEQYRTQDQVEQYLARVFSTNSKFDIYPTRYGWVCRPTPSTEGPRNPNLPVEPGQGSYVVNAQTGVVTAHPSLHPITIGEQYDEAIRTGQPIPGGQVYPRRWKVTLQRTHEDATEIEYQVMTESLTTPPEPTTEHRLTINKNTLQTRTSVLKVPEASYQAMAWAYEHRTNQTWPENGTYEV